MGFGAQFNIYILNATENADGNKLWRRRRDSNPRDPFGSNGFQDRRFQPLTHSSAFDFSVFRDTRRSFVFGASTILQGNAGIGAGEFDGKRKGCMFAGIYERFCFMTWARLSIWTSC